MSPKPIISKDHSQYHAIISCVHNTLVCPDFAARLRLGMISKNPPNHLYTHVTLIQPVHFLLACIVENLEGNQAWLSGIRVCFE